MENKNKNTKLSRLVDKILPQITEILGVDTISKLKDYFSGGFSVGRDGDISGVVSDCIKILSTTIKDGGINRLPSIKPVGLPSNDTVEVGSDIVITNQIEYIDGSFYSYGKNGEIEFIPAGCRPGRLIFYKNGLPISMSENEYHIKTDRIGGINMKVVQNYECSENAPKKSNGMESYAHIGSGACSYSIKYFAYNTIFFGFGDTYQDAMEESILQGRYRTTDDIIRSFKDCKVVPMQFAWYLYPSRLGKVNIVGYDSTFTYNFELKDTIDYTNSNGYTEPYYIYRSIDPIAYDLFNVNITN